MTHPIEHRADTKQDFQYTAEREDSALLLTLVGELDLEASKSVQDVLNDAFLDPDCIDLIIDMSRLTFLDSSGLGIFVAVMQSLRDRGGSIYVAGCPPSISRAFAITRLDRLFHLAENVPDARAARQRNANEKSA